jgi:hypothetical protein
VPITSTDLLSYISANHPSDDVSTTGGAILATIRPEFTQFTATAALVLKSNGADTRAVDVGYRTTAGTLTLETLTLSGTTEVPASASAERVLFVIAQTTNATRTVSLLQGSGGVVRAQIPPNEKGVTALFIDSISATGAVSRYEKVFLLNNHATLTLSSAVVTLTADPAARIMIGVAPTKNDTATTPNRLTAPAGVSFVDDNIDITVPTGALAAGEGIGVSIKEGLLAGDAPIKSSFTIRLSGASS